MEKRKIYHVTKFNTVWMVKSEGDLRLTSIMPTKQQAIESAVEHAIKNQPSQVIIHLENGEIEKEYTYTDDPISSKG